MASRAAGASWTVEATRGAMGSGRAVRRGELFRDRAGQTGSGPWAMPFYMRSLVDAHAGRTERPTTLLQLIENAVRARPPLLEPHCFSPPSGLWSAPMASRMTQSWHVRSARTTRYDRDQGLPWRLERAVPHRVAPRPRRARPRTRSLRDLEEEATLAPPLDHGHAASSARSVPRGGRRGRATRRSKSWTSPRRNCRSTSPGLPARPAASPCQAEAQADTSGRPSRS